MQRQSLTTFHRQSDAQSVPEQWLFWEKPHQPKLDSFIVLHCVICHGISLWLVWVSCPLCVSSWHLAHPQPTHCGGRARNRSEI